MYHRRGYRPTRHRRVALVDLLLVLALLLGAGRSAAPLFQDLLANRTARRTISRMTSVSDNTQDPRRKELLREAQAYNGALGAGTGHVDNKGMRGGNEGTEDILSLAADGEQPSLPYELQLCERPTEPICWLEVPSASIAQPVYHATSEEVLAQGVGHLASSSLPVGGTPSRCVLAGHSGMENAHMFDHLDEMETGDVIILHTLGDAYWYEVFQTEVVTPREADLACSAATEGDLCTLVTCTPYGINSHRLLVHARRIAARSVRPKGRSAYRLITDRRTAPPLALASMAVVLLATLLLAGMRRGSPARAVKESRRQGTRRQPGSRSPRGHAETRRTAALLPARQIPKPMRRGMRESKARSPGIGSSRRWVWRLGIPFGTILCLAAAAVAGHLTHEDAGYQRLEQQVVVDAEAQEGGDHTKAPTIDWDILHDINPEVAAWVEVEGTDISLPVVAPEDKDMAFYLRHNLWRQWSLQGTPFLDHRSDARGPHRLVYGHHLTSGGQFSQLQHAYEQATFDRIGPCRWSTPDAGTATLAPLCALSVDQWHEGIQHFAFGDTAELHVWLEGITGEASARTRDWREVIDDAETVVTLVTCSSELSDQPWRTLVVFAG